MIPNSQPNRVAIACGGTGGHLFPGLAVGRELAALGCKVTLLVSPKDVDQTAVAGLTGLDVATLPAVGLQGKNYPAFVFGFWKAYRASLRLFKTAGSKPDAVLAMGGFTAAPPVIAGRRLGAAAFLHESNTIPGRANRLLARWVDRAFVGFPSAADRLRAASSDCVGTPVRESIAHLRSHRDTASARIELGLDPSKPVLLVTGGSQGARGLNSLVTSALPELSRVEPELQFVHLSGTPDFDAVRIAHAGLGARSVVRPFLKEMDLALAAADVVISRAGASSMAELAALRLPSILVPLPTAQDNHQFHNAEAFARSGAAIALDQGRSTAAELISHVVVLLRDADRRKKMQSALAEADSPDAAAVIAGSIVEHLREPFTNAMRRKLKPAAKPQANTAHKPLPRPALVPAKEVA